MRATMAIVAGLMVLGACDRGCDMSDPVGGGGPTDPGPSNSALCESTGGVWEEGDCACAQDGATLHHEFMAAVGCQFPDDSELVEDLEAMALWEAIEAHFAVGQPVWVIDRPGAFDRVTSFASAAALKAHLEPMGWLGYSATVGVCDAPIADAPIPGVDCDGDLGMDAEGCLLATVSDEFHRVSTVMQATVDYDLGYWSPAEIDHARQQEQWILKVFVNSEHGVTLAFRRHAGAWILTVVDLSRYSCSA